MYNVKSKYKNPDKFIQGLQQEIKRIERVLNYARERENGLRGESIIVWDHKKNTPNRQACGSSCDLGKLRTGDSIVIKGKVIMVKESTCKAGNHESEMEYDMLETKRVKDV